MILHGLITKGQHAYYHARYYDPAVGIFASADTCLDGLNRYAYVHDSPATGTDPTGHCFPICLITAAVGAIAGAAIAYGVQVHSNYQTGSGNPSTSNINRGAVGAGAAVGGIVGPTMGVGLAAVAGTATVGGVAATVGDAAVSVGSSLADAAATGAGTRMIAGAVLRLTTLHRLVLRLLGPAYEDAYLAVQATAE